jgi:very-short-patch-repair endonuclease
MSIEDVLQLAEAQHGCVRRADVRAAGVSAKVLRRWVTTGEWVPEGPRVLRRAGAPGSKGTRLMRAVLDAGPGAFVSHQPAAAWWGLPGFDLLAAHVTRPRGISGCPPTLGQVLHEVLDLTPGQVTVLDGVPIVRPERLAFELFASVHPLRATRAVETAWAKGLLSGRSLHAVFEELGGQGRKGTVAMRDFLETHDALWVPPASNLEARFAAIAGDARLGPYRRQVDLGDDRWAGRVDFLHVDLPLVVEVQSERYHSALLDRAHDARRRARLEASGFRVEEVWDVDVWHHRRAVVRQIRLAEHHLRRLLQDRARQGTDPEQLRVG